MPQPAAKAAEAAIPKAPNFHAFFPDHDPDSLWFLESDSEDCCDSDTMVGIRLLFAVLSRQEPRDARKHILFDNISVRVGGQIKHRA